jgi:hypothetical protein
LALLLEEEEEVAGHLEEEEEGEDILHRCTMEAAAILFLLTPMDLLAPLAYLRLPIRLEPTALLLDKCSRSFILVVVVVEEEEGEERLLTLAAGMGQEATWPLGLRMLPQCKCTTRGSR